MYEDEYVRIDSTGILVKVYYFPFMSKRIPWASVGTVRNDAHRGGRCSLLFIYSYDGIH